jgi:hypothetical protein
MLARRLVVGFQFTQTNGFSGPLSWIERLCSTSVAALKSNRNAFTGARVDDPVGHPEPYTFSIFNARDQSESYVGESLGSWVDEERSELR